MYLKRTIDTYLQEWRKEEDHKPLLLRGARQVGKTRSIKELGKSFSSYLEINFEENLAVHALFEGSLTPSVLLENLTAIYNTSIKPGETLLFFDEIQSCPNAIRALRFFAEKIPELHVIAAGSLLEFALAEIPSFGVGRIRSLFMYPLSFQEFLLAVQEEPLLTMLKKAAPSHPLTKVIHEKLQDYYRSFLILGGMPEVVSSYIKNRDFRIASRVLDDLIISFEDDFAKYKKRVPTSRIRSVFNAVVQQTGSKFIYSKAAQANHQQIKEAVELLIMAGMVIPVVHSAANGIPLGAETNPKKKKMLLLDTGIFLRLLGLEIAPFFLSKEFSVINKGNLAELSVGLELLKSYHPFTRVQLYYWHREARNSNAEVDYVLQRGHEILPIEVKADTKGSMQSMQYFLKAKSRPFGVRVSMENFSIYENIQVFPLYATSGIKTKLLIPKL